MNCNQIRYYLHSYDGLKKEIEHLKEALTIYKCMNVSGMKAQAITGMPQSHSNDSKTEQMALKRVEYMEDLETEIDGKLRLLIAINSIYFYLQEPERSIIEMRYMIIPQGRPKYNWKEIAAEVGETEKKCWKIDGEVIRKIQIKLLESDGTFEALKNINKLIS